MSWFKVDDRFTFHPKVLAAGNEAVGAWVRLGSWCSAHLTDGRVPRAIALSICSETVLQRLINAKIVRKQRRNYELCNYHEYNPSKEEVEANRAATADRVKRFRSKRNAVGNAVTNTVGHASPVPSRPVPKKTEAFASRSEETAPPSSMWPPGMFESGK
jgi:hypothetical protein